MHLSRSDFQEAEPGTDTMNFVLHIVRSLGFFKKPQLPFPCVSVQRIKNVEGSGEIALVVVPAFGYSAANLP